VHPQERARRVKRAVTRKYRQTVYGESDTINHRHPTGVSNEAYDAEKFGSPYDVSGNLYDVTSLSII
jgi:hypothetical protein